MAVAEEFLENVDLGKEAKDRHLVQRRKYSDAKVSNKLLFLRHKPEPNN